jgi:hypothetical protein
MIPHDHSPAVGQRNRVPHPGNKPSVEETTLKSEKVQIERKTFIFALKENPRGRFLRITEDVNGRRDNIIIPAPGLGDFKRILDDMVQCAAETPAPPAPPAEANEVPEAQ